MALALVFVALVLLPVVLLRVPETKWFERQASSLAKDEGVGLSWQALACTWTSGRCVLRDLRVELDGVRVQLDTLELAWRWRPLLSKRVEVTSLKVTGVHVERFAESAPSSTPSSPLSASLEVLKTPLPIAVEALTLDDVSVRWPVGSRTLEVERLALAGAAKVGEVPDITLSLSGLEVRVLDGDVTKLDAQLGLKLTAALLAERLSLAADATVTRSTPAWPLPGPDVLSLGVHVDIRSAEQRLDVELEKLSALSAAITGTARASLPDEGAPRLEGADVTATLPPMLPLVRLFEPSVTADGAVLRLDAKGDTATATLRAEQLGALGSEVRDLLLTATATQRGDRVDADARLNAHALKAGPARANDVALRVTADDFDARQLRGVVKAAGSVKSLDVDGDVHTALASSTLKAVANIGSSIDLALSASPGHAKVTMKDLAVDAEPAPLTIDATLDAAQRLKKAVAVLPLKRVEVVSPTGRLQVAEMQHTLTVTGDPRDDAAVALSMGLFDVVGRRNESAVTVKKVELASTGRLQSLRPQHVEGALTHPGLHGHTDGGRLEFAVDVAPGEIDARIDGTLPPLTLHLDATKRDATVHGNLLASATSLGVVAPLVPVDLGGFTLDPAALGFTLKASVDMPDVARPTVLSLDADLSTPKLVAQRDARKLSVDALRLHVTHRHADRIDKGLATLRLERPTVEAAHIAGVVESKLTVDLDRARGVGALTLTLDAAKTRNLALGLDLRREKDGRLHHDLDVDVAHLGAWAPLVGELSATPPGLMLEQLSAHLVSHGDTLGLLDADFMPAAGWKATSDTTLHADLDVRHVVHHVEGEETRVPHVNMRIDAGVLHGAVKLAAKLEVPSLEMDVGTQHVALTGVHQLLSMTSEVDPDAGVLHLDLDGTIDELEQNLWPPWQPSAVHLNIDGNVDKLSSLTIEKFLLESPSAGTKLELANKLRAGGDTGDDVAGQRFRLQGKLTQDLSKLDGAPSAFLGQGVVSVGLRVQSADLATFRLRGKVELNDAGVQLPSSHVVVEGATGTVPFEEAFSIDATHGVRLVVAGESSPFARARAAESQPFLSQDGTLSVRRVRWKGTELAPVVASLALEPNRFSLSRLKAEHGNARISGQLFVDFRPGEEVVTFRGTLTGLERKGAAVPLDANAAFTFVPRRLELDGRVQVVRTSKEHLLDLLDVVDPHREVGSLNTVRSAMAFGFPREAQLSFADGLLSMDIAFGGLASLVDVGTVRGVSLGPFFNRYVAPALGSSP